MNTVHKLNIQSDDFVVVKKPLFEVFGIEPPERLKDLLVSVREWDLPNPEVPLIDEEYYFTIPMVRDLLTYMSTGTGQSPYIYGSHGTSKTSSAEQIAARLGRTFLDTDASANLEVIDLIGQMMPNTEGGFSFKYGILSRAMKEGHVLVINEYDLLPTLEQKALNRIVEDRKFTIVQTGEVIIAHRDFRLIFTGNTNNTGSSANFVSAGSGDSSINDRLKFIKSHYLPKEVEKQILQNVIRSECRDRGVDETEAEEVVSNLEVLMDVMLKVAKSIRESHESAQNSGGLTAGLECSLSIRSLKEWCRTMFQYSFWEKDPLTESFEVAFVAGVRHEEQPLVRKILKDRAASVM